MQHKTIMAQGGTVHYWIDKKENMADSIVFTHGLTADHTMFERQVSYFSNNYTVLVWDVPMHGLSRPYQSFSYRDTAEILHSILRKEGIEKTFLVGMSMGGYPSQHFADSYPDMYFIMENKDVDFPFPVLILVGDNDSTGKVKAYCKEWAKQTGYPLHIISRAKHFSNGDNPEQVNSEIENFICRTIHMGIK
ncbi:2-(acetamidomethylene)succinate hydrolase [Lachnospiraceae bacterium]|nr:2-(acetamidomethylene)succinate hydrolase [Lachnospiraceae bacterium]GFI01629.1 2-(acetamidomethylene)succinate hydrolase [Lachnospiraceae bacterium]